MATSHERLDRPNSKNNHFKVHSIIFKIMYALMPTQAIEIVPIGIPKKKSCQMHAILRIGSCQLFWRPGFFGRFFDILYDLDDHETLHIIRKRIEFGYLFIILASMYRDLYPFENWSTFWSPWSYVIITFSYSSKLIHWSGKIRCITKCLQHAIQNDLLEKTKNLMFILIFHLSKA